MAKKSKSIILIYALLLFVLFFALIRIIIGSQGRFFTLELGGFFILLLLSLIASFGYNKNWGERLFLFIFTFYIINLVLIWKFTGALYLTLLLLSVLGAMLIVMEIIKFGHSKRKRPIQSTLKPYQEPYSQVFDPLPTENDGNQFSVVTEDYQEETNAPDKVSAKVNSRKSANISKKRKTTYKPGKFVASSRSNIYHAPKCEWAKKIKKERRNWFKSKEAAWEKGYKAHNCVE